MWKALLYKEWIKTRWYLLLALSVTLGFAGYALLKLHRAVALTGAGHIWEVMVTRNAVFIDQMQYVPLLAGLALAAVQYLPEVHRKCLKLTLHLPVPALATLGVMLAFGVAVLAVLFGLLVYRWEMPLGRATLLGIAGIVADVKTMNSKNGTPGAKVVLEDFSGNYEFVLFGSDYQRYMPFLQLHNQIFIDGEIGERYFLKPEDRAAGKKSPYGFKIKNISLLGTLCETRLGGLDLQLDTRLIDADFRKKLLKLLQSNKGKLPLNIHLIDIETGYKLDFFSKKFKVDVSQEFLNRLSDLGFKYNLLRKN